MGPEIAPRRESQQRERRYVSEYVSLAYPNRPVTFNLRLGQPPQEMSVRYPYHNIDRLARVWKRFVDAVVVNSSEFVLIEAKIRRPVEAVGEILTYRELLYDTPELRPWGKLPIRAEMVCPVADPSLAHQFLRLDVQVKVYAPAWVIDYLHEVNK